MTDECALALCPCTSSYLHVCVVLLCKMSLVRACVVAVWPVAVDSRSKVGACLCWLLWAMHDVARMHLVLAQSPW
jgi:hypothetical protein